ncbi:MAG: aminotransferase [Paracoccaceae bacterium]|nr:aminotransferase [Paracoccaceae bacterium]
MTKPAGLIAIEAEMAHQNTDAIAAFHAARGGAENIAASLRRTGRLLLLGMGGSHAVGRAVEPLYRDLGIDAVAVPLSEQLGQPLPIDARTLIVTSQSGESAEVLRWFDQARPSTDIFGLTMEPHSTLAGLAPCLIGAGGTETGFAATRSLMVTLALHAAVLQALGAQMQAALDVLTRPETPDITAALAAMTRVTCIVASGRRLQGLAEALALGLIELSRLPCFALEGGQMRHGPMEMLGPRIGVVLFRAQDATADLVGGMAQSVVATGAPVVVFDASGARSVAGAVTVSIPPARDMAAILALLPASQQFMLDFAASRVADVGTPLRSQKITRSE